MKRARSYWQLANSDRLPLLVVAAAVVGIAIAMDGDGRRIINGIGGVLWFIASFLIVTRAFAAGVTVKLAALAALVIMVLTYLIKPVDPLLAAIGFGWGGCVVGFAGREVGSRLGAMLAALWLPTHLLIAVGKAIVRTVRDEPAPLRTDPPPTAALVPLIMVTAAWLFAAWTAEWRQNRDGRRLFAPRSPLRPGRTYE